MIIHKKLLHLLTALYLLVFINISAQPNPDPVPPYAPVRTPAEFEPIQSVVVGWEYYDNYGDPSKYAYNDFHYFLVKNILDAGAEVNIIVNNMVGNDQEASIISYLLYKDPDIQLDRIKFHDDEAFIAGMGHGFDWTRDYLAQTIYSGGDKQIGLVNWYKVDNDFWINATTNRLCENLYQQYNLFILPAYGDEGGFNFDGGSFLTDGFGLDISTEAILRYGQDIDYVSQKLKEYNGINTAVILDYVFPEPADPMSPLYLLWQKFVGHIDIFLKFIDEENILYAHFVDDDPLGQMLNEGMDAWLEHFSNNVVSIYGRPINFIPIETPIPKYVDDPDAQDPGTKRWMCYSYLNFLIVNDHVLMPVFGEEYPDFDIDAMNTIQQYMPGYTVETFPLTYQFPEDYHYFQEAVGFMHCYAHEINKEDVIQTYHPRFLENQYRDADIRFLAKFWTKGNINNAYVHLKRPGESVFQQYSMNRVADVFYADIPALSTTGEAQYFIKAVNSNGTLGYKPQNAYVSDPEHDKYEPDPLKQTYLTMNIDGLIPTDLTIQNDITSFKTYHASNDIDINSCSVTGKGFLDVRAGNEIRIEPNFHVAKGAYFHASAY